MILKLCTPEDKSLVVPLIYASGPAAFDFVFRNKQKTALDFLHFAFIRKGGEFSYDNHYALWDENKLVAVGAVFGYKKSSSFIFKDALNIISFYGWQSLPRALNGLRIETIIKLPKTNEITLGHLGVKEGLRGKGYGTQLLNFLMEKGARKRNQKFILDVSKENPKAKGLYARLGFKVTQEYVSTYQNLYSKVPNHFRMELV
jgi:ribosomal protein S18 acetylase RimI-like enzyme